MQEAEAAAPRPGARLTRFGFEPTAADVQVSARARSWRLTRAALALGLCWALVPVVFFVPPHIPWVIAALGSGIYLARRRWTERYTLRSLDGACPRCGHPLSIASEEPLRLPHSMTCEGCLDEILLEVDVDTLPAGGAR